MSYNFIKKIKNTLKNLVRKSHIKNITKHSKEFFDKKKRPQKGNALKKIQELVSDISYFSKTYLYAVVDHSLNLNNRPLYHKVFITVLFAILSYSTGKIVGQVLSLKPSSSAAKAGKGPISQGSKVKSRSLNLLVNKNFISSQKKEALGSTPQAIKEIKVIEAPKVCTESATKSSLPIEILNTVVLQNEAKSVISVKFKGKEKHFRQGDKIGKVAQIGKIERLKIVVKNLNNKKCEYIAKKLDLKLSKKIKIFNPDEGKKILPKKTLKGITNEGNNYTISKKLIQDKLKNINTILTQARAIQINNPDGSLSFKIVEIEPGSIYSFLGLKNDNVIKSINGKKISNLNEVMNLFGSLTTLTQLSLTIEDNEGTENTLEYDFN